MSNVVDQEGWGWPRLSRKAHYFTREGRSLCLKWAFTGEREVNQNVTEKRGPDDCAECHRRLLKRSKP